MANGREAMTFPSFTMTRPPFISPSASMAFRISPSFVPAATILCESWAMVVAMAPSFRLKPFTIPKPIFPVWWCLSTTTILSWSSEMEGIKTPFADWTDSITLFVLSWLGLISMIWAFFVSPILICRSLSVRSGIWTVEVSDDSALFLAIWFPRYFPISATGFPPLYTLDIPIPSRLSSKMKSAS